MLEIIRDTEGGPWLPSWREAILPPEMKLLVLPQPAANYRVMLYLLHPAQDFETRHQSFEPFAISIVDRNPASHQPVRLVLEGPGPEIGPHDIRYWRTWRNALTRVLDKATEPFLQILEELLPQAARAPEQSLKALLSFNEPADFYRLLFRLQEMATRHLGGQFDLSAEIKRWTQFWEDTYDSPYRRVLDAYRDRWLYVDEDDMRAYTEEWSDVSGLNKPNRNALRSSTLATIAA